MTPAQVDAHNQQMLQRLHKEARARAFRVYQDMYRNYGVLMRCTDADRSYDIQAKRYAQGRTEPGKIVTWARPGQSWHQFWAALDSCFAGANPKLVDASKYAKVIQGADPYLEKMEDRKEAEMLWQAFGGFGRAHGFQWGGDWSPEKREYPHLQFTFGLKISEVEEFYKLGGKEAVFIKYDQILAASR